LLVAKAEKTKKFHPMQERCGNLNPVSKGNRGNKKSILGADAFASVEATLYLVADIEWHKED
jgi:hypothetical protein